MLPRSRTKSASMNWGLSFLFIPQYHKMSHTLIAPMISDIFRYSLKCETKHAMILQIDISYTSFTRSKLF